MSNKKIVDLTFELVQPIVQKNNFELIDVEYVKEGTYWYLRVFIEKDNGINIDDCQVVSEELGKKLDELDPIKIPYHLEVSSPGLDRPLKSERDFKRYEGEDIEVYLYKPYENQKVHNGRLLAFKDNKIFIIKDDETEVSFDREKVSKVKRLFKF